jgi:hypothetical protein
MLLLCCVTSVIYKVRRGRGAMGKRGPPARVMPDWIWEYAELHTVGQSQSRVHAAPASAGRGKGPFSLEVLVYNYTAHGSWARRPLVACTAAPCSPVLCGQAWGWPADSSLGVAAFGVRAH